MAMINQQITEGDQIPQDFSTQWAALTHSPEGLTEWPQLLPVGFNTASGSILSHQLGSPNHTLKLVGALQNDGKVAGFPEAC